MLRSKWMRAFAVIAALGTAVALPVTSTAARPTPPTVKLISVLKHATAVRYGDNKHLFLYSPGIYLAASGGAFEIDATRQPDGTIALWQVSRGAHGTDPIRQITAPRAVRLARGLPQFLHLSITNSKGVSVLEQDMPYCLDGYGEARVDTSGPDQPTYPYDCGGSLSEAAVWGIDQGWADELDLGFRFKAPDGTYKLTVSIGTAYAKQLQIPPDSASASIALTVKTQHIGKCGGQICLPAAATAQALSGRTGPQTGEGPRATQPAATDPSGWRHTDGEPDLRALPAHDLSVHHNRRNGHDYLAFGATIWDAGSGPLDLEGFRAGSSEVMQATQFIYQDGRPVRSQVVGQFEFDHRKGHHHWHMEDIAQYDLLNASGNRVLLSGKQSFCLAPTDAINLTLPGADWRPDQTALWSACEGESAIWLREVLPAGWGDTYYQDVAGQAFNITSLPNGHYQLRITTDPNHNLLETDYTNNVGLLPITLGGRHGHRTVTIG